MSPSIDEIFKAPNMSSLNFLHQLSKVIKNHGFPISYTNRNNLKNAMAREKNYREFWNKTDVSYKTN